MAEELGALGQGGKVALPVTTFLYTQDQIAALINVSMSDLRLKYLYYVGRTPGHKLRHQMQAHNIAPENDRPDWRVAEQDFVRWLRAMGFNVRTEPWV